MYGFIWLEGLLESSGAYPFMYRGRIRGDEGGDVNALTLSGIYNLFDVGINIPDTGDAYPMNYSILKVYNAGGIILQEITNHNYSYLNHVYIRISPDNGLKWYDWRKIL